MLSHFRESLLCRLNRRLHIPIRMGRRNKSGFEFGRRQQNAAIPHRLEKTSKAIPIRFRGGIVVRHRAPGEKQGEQRSGPVQGDLDSGFVGAFLQTLCQALGAVLQFRIDGRPAAQLFQDGGAGRHG